VLRRHLLADSDSETAGALTSAGPKRRPESVWFVQLVVGNRLVFVCCIIVFLIYLTAVVVRIVFNAPVRICRMRQNTDTLVVFEFPPFLLDALYLQFLFTHVSFSLMPRSHDEAGLSSACQASSVV